MSRKKSSAAVKEEFDEDGGEKVQGVSAFISKIFKVKSDSDTENTRRWETQSYHAQQMLIRVTCFSCSSSTLQIVNESDPNIVCWNDRGDGFIVKQEYKFASEVMVHHFRHQNISSFVRQLNFYGFHKRSGPAGATSFYHPSFKKGRPDLLSLIQRKTTETTHTGTKQQQPIVDLGLRDVVTDLQNEVSELRQQNEDLFKIQQRILYIFSRYMRATQSGQVGGNNQQGLPNQQQGQMNESGSKRIRSDRGRNDDGPMQNPKRQRLLMESKPDSPPAEYHSDTMYSSPHNSSSSSSYQPKSNAEYFHSSNNNAAAPSGYSPGSGSDVVDLNTDSYNQPHGSGYGQHQMGGNIYDNHNLSDLNWSTDPVQAINDLIHKSGTGLQQVLNSNPIPMQMGRPGMVMNAAAAGQPYLVDSNNFSGGYGNSGGGSNNAMARGGGRGRGGNNMGSSSSNRGGGSNQQQGDLMDLGSQLANTNPRQLLELLDRMGAEGVPNDQLTPRGSSSARGSGRSRGGGRDQSASSSSSSATYMNGGHEGIQGVFEDMDEMTAVPPQRGGRGGKRAAAGRGGKGRGGASASQVDPPIYVPTTGGATLSPLDDDPPFPIKASQSPSLSSMPLPTSPVSPFISDAQLEGFPGASTPSGGSHPSFANQFELRSPHAPLGCTEPLSLSRQSTIEPLPFAINSPYLPAAAPPPLTDLQPLTPNMMM